MGFNSGSKGLKFKENASLFKFIELQIMISISYVFSFINKQTMTSNILYDTTTAAAGNRISLGIHYTSDTT